MKPERSYDKESVIEYMHEMINDLRFYSKFVDYKSLGYDGKKLQKKLNKMQKLLRKGEYENVLDEEAIEWM